MKKKSVLFLLFLAFFSTAQQLKLEDIMKGPEFVGNQPNNHRWSTDGKTIFFEWNPTNELGDKTYYWQKGFTEPKVLNNPAEYNCGLSITGQDQFQVIYFLFKGALFSYDKKKNQTKPIIQSSNRITNLQRSNNPDVLFFTQNKNSYQLNIRNFQLIQLTNFVTGNAPSTEKKETFLETQQENLFKFIQEDKKRNRFREEQANNTKLNTPENIYTNNAELENVTISPNGNFVVFRLTDYPKSVETKVEHFITSDGYTKNKSAREKVSISNNPKVKLGIYDIIAKSTYYVDFTNLSGIKDNPQYFNDYKDLKDKKPETKLISMEAPVFNNDGSFSVLEARSFDNKDRWIIQIDLKTGKITEIDHQHDKAWIGGPGIAGYNFDIGTLGFLNDNKTIYFQSEATGFSHLYTYNLETKTKNQLTSGKWEVREVELSKLNNSFYITTTSTHPGNRSFFKLEIDSKVMMPILTKDGAHEVVISPDEKQLLVRYSYSNKAWDLYVADNKINAELKQITFSETTAFKNYSWKIPEIITFKATDGINVNARLYQPKAENKNNAAIIFVHGAGYLQNAHKYWSSYNREYMFHNLLTDLGYTVLDIDYRASDGYGRDFRTGIYRFMGGKDLSDQIDGKKYLVEKLGINNDKVGIYGGSYGGFITLMALLTKPGEFKAGAALRSVTDWAHYNQGYTANILNFPETDPDAYYKSSPINFADNLKDKLLMLHGMVDDNVQFQDVVRLSQLFIEKGKKNWDLAVFPVEAHGFVKTYSWVDEYRRILDLFNEELLGKK
jgi:dipeptidyl aminopeptidase/acylaminoacyl peptidase